MISKSKNQAEAELAAIVRRYFGHAGDDRLQTIHHQYPNAATLSKFDYSYDAVGNMLTWRQQTNSNAATQYGFSYDPADELTSATNQTTDATPSIVKRYAYMYDQAGNRAGEQIDDAVTGATYDDMNRRISQQPTGGLLFAGTVSEPATITINGRPGTVKADNTFLATVPITAGTNRVTIAAVDPTGNASTAAYDVDSTGTMKTFTYDANGNLTADGIRTFEWDARNQLVAITTADHRTEYLYDGFRHRTTTFEKINGVVVSEIRTVWCGDQVCEERDAGNLVTRRATSFGEQVNGAPRYFARDHLDRVARRCEPLHVCGRQSSPESRSRWFVYVKELHSGF